MTSAYDEIYLENARKNLGHMMDYAVNSCGLKAGDFFDMFLVCGIADEFSRGNPTYVVGMSGCELVKLIVSRAGKKMNWPKEEMYLDRSPEYWSGWALAYYQWLRTKSFKRIVKAVPMEEIIGMYGTLHEADISKFVTIIDEKLKAFYVETNLKRIRQYAGYSQSQLAKEADVGLRQIQLLEQRQRDINKAQAASVLRLARALGCDMEELLE